MPKRKLRVKCAQLKRIATPSKKPYDIESSFLDLCRSRTPNEDTKDQKDEVRDV